MSTRRSKFLEKGPAEVDVGCSWRRRPKLPLFFSPLPKAKPQNTPSLILSPSSTTTIWETSHTSVSSSSAAATAAPAPTAANSSSSSPSCFADYTSSLFPEVSPPESPETNTCMASTMAALEAKTKRETDGSLVVVKESSDPYADFRDSMLQMVLETEICAWEDLCDLLHRFLVLNAPCHHHVIIHAFAEVYCVIFSPSDCSDANADAAAAAGACRYLRGP